MTIAHSKTVSPNRFASLKRRALPLAAAVGLTVAALSPSLARAGDDFIPSITITGQGQVSVAPDMAVITTQVVSPGSTAPEALAANSKAMKAVIDEVKSAGIEAKDIQTSGFSIYPRYDNSKQGQNKAPKIVGYDVRNGVTINVRDLAKLGELLNTVVESGANQIGGISFQISDPDEKLNEARKKAVADARARAELLAEAAGSKLGNVLDISENGGYRPQPRGMMMMEARVSADAVPVEVGENTIEASVNIRWELVSQ